MQPTSIGRAVPRKEARDKVTGRARYVDDVTFPGMIHGVTVRSRVPRGRIVGIHFAPGIPWEELTIKGVTQPVQLTGKIAATTVTDPMGRERLGLKLETEIDRTKYGVSWNAPNQSGGDYVANDVKLIAELAFVKAEA